ncbi:MAG: MBOAT family O-acyltransferase [Candidatus Coproplasma sp.]
MSFNSPEFILFLAVVVLLYWVLPFKFRWVLLLAASYLFYMSWNVWLIVLILITTVTAYLSGIFISRTESAKIKKLWLAVALAICLGLLIFFKYINFILESAVGIIRLFNAEQDSIVLNVILPVGISFYTFQTLSYVVDVYRGSYPAEKHFGYFALYVSYFPQLVAGPIERPENLLPQLRSEHKLNGEDVLAGAKYLLSGFFRKCVIADFCGIFVDKVYADLGSANALAVFCASALFIVHIYNDFAGYSEIALGSARLMGVKLSKNFDKPLTSASFSEFFRRWHVTLNKWFTQYVYIPLGGNRKGRLRQLLNVMIVFALCGLWHGANWTYVLWGLAAGAFVCMENLLKKPALRACGKLGIDPQSQSLRLLRQVAVFIMFVFTCVLFRAQNIQQIGIAYRQMFTGWGLSAAYFAQAFESLGLTPDLFILLVLCLSAMVLIYYLPSEESKTALPLNGEGAKSDYGATMAVFVYGAIAVALCWLGLLANSDVSGFAYFQF